MFKILLATIALTAQIAVASTEVPVAEFSFNDRFLGGTAGVNYINYTADLFEDGRLVVTKKIVCKTCRFFRDPTDVYSTQVSQEAIDNLLNYKIETLKGAKIETIQRTVVCKMMAPPFKGDLGLRVRRANGDLKLVLSSTACYLTQVTQPKDEYAANLAKDLKDLLRLLAYEALPKQ